MQDQQTATADNQQEKMVSPFEGIKEMDDIKAFNILVQAANAAQKAGALSVSDSVYVAKAAEHLGEKFNTILNQQ
jgi:hypothetical protein